jgi:protein involved in polysaccharide export with SLBB domain
LRSATTVSQGLAVAGGPTGSARHADVVVFRRHGDELVAVTKVNIKRMYDARNLSEDPLLRTGDTLFVPKSSWSAISPFLPRPGILLSPFVR